MQHKGETMPDFCENSLLLIILSKSAITMSMKRTICINILISAAHNLQTPHNCTQDTRKFLGVPRPKPLFSHFGKRPDFSVGDILSLSLGSRLSVPKNCAIRPQGPNEFLNNQHSRCLAQQFFFLFQDPKLERNDKKQ